ncbi:MAG: 5'-3' exoribonuclease 2 [Sclerophora amabilis]|nr:MAG: 5'-3' exoribonuclease 2 [Sclerophora amabilis]
MGVPALFRWLSQKYPKIVSPVVEEQPREVEGQQIPVDTTAPNPNGEEMDNLYLDMNGIVHPCSHPEDKPPPENEEQMMLAVFEYTERVVNMARPRKLLMIAVDGVAPRAKMNQQRSRRFRSAKEAKEKDEDKAELVKMLKAQNGGVIDESTTASMNKKTWDSNAITPGTPFMDILAASLRYWVAYKLNTDPAWAKLKIIISDATVPGEGEHKIMEFIRSQRSSPEHDPNTRHVIYGLDADLIMLGLGTHEPHFRVLREDVFFQESKARSCHICGQKGHKAEECKGEAKQKDGEFDEKDKAQPLKPFIWLHVSVLREYLAAEMYVPAQQFEFDLERALDDWVFMCFFVGNDFLPHLPSLDIRENGIDTLIAIWRDNIPAMGGYLTKDGHVDLEKAQMILNALAKQEDAIFRRRRQTEERKDANAKRRKLEDQNRNNHRYSEGGNAAGGTRRRSSPDYGKVNVRDPAQAASSLPLFKPANVTKEAKAMTHDMVVNRATIFKANEANKSAAAALKSQLLDEGAPTAGNGDPTGSEGDQASTNGNGASHSLQSNGLAEHRTLPSALGKRKAETLDGDDPNVPDTNARESLVTPKATDDELPPDTVRLWEEGYADRYYEQKFDVDPKDIEFRHKVARAYAEGLAWVLLYYFQGCPSWTWYYPYHYAPFAADFADLQSMKISFEKGAIFKPFEQLMGVLPAASNHAIPEVFHELMTNEDSEIIDFYPENFPIDLNGKKFAWQGVALLPFIDSNRLLDAMAKRYPLLSAEDAARNEMGRDVLLLSDGHPLYDEIASNFYSKKQSSPKYKLNPRISEGLAGKIEKNDTFLPRSALVFPLETDVMPNVDDDRSISVHYDMPQSTSVHKSMLLRGVKFPTPALDHADIEATKSRASRTGRGYGGAPFRGENGRGRGRGRFDYNVQRSNPIPIPQGNGFRPHGNRSGYDMPQWSGSQPPPPPGMSSSWPPPFAPGSGNFFPGPPPLAPGQVPPPPPSSGHPYNYGGPPQGYPPPPSAGPYGHSDGSRSDARHHAYGGHRDHGGARRSDGGGQQGWNGYNRGYNGNRRY